MVLAQSFDVGQSEGKLEAGQQTARLVRQEQTEAATSSFETQLFDASNRPWNDFRVIEAGKLFARRQVRKVSFCRDLSCARGFVCHSTVRSIDPQLATVFIKAFFVVIPSVGR